jgi:hypothetical protein
VAYTNGLLRRFPERTRGREKAQLRLLTIGRRIESGISQYERGILATKRQRSVTRSPNVYTFLKIAGVEGWCVLGIQYFKM